MKKLLIIGLSLLSFISQAQTRDTINIPAYSGLTGITRKATVVETNNKYAYQSVVVSVRVFHYKNGVSQGYLDKTVYLTASNSILVNPNTGAYCTPSQQGCIGEYQYLWNVVNVYKLYTQVQLEDMYILLRINEINEKIYN